MNIQYTAHAEYQLQERKAEKHWVEETVNSPDITKNFGNKVYVVKKLNGKTLKVVYVRQNYIKVITLYWI